jgi:hypothetical protein
LRRPSPQYGPYRHWLVQPPYCESPFFMPLQDGSVGAGAAASPQSHCSSPVRAPSPQRGWQLDRFVCTPASVTW